MTSFNDLTNNSELGSNGRYLVKSRKKENALKASTQVWGGGLIIVVEYGSVSYVKMTDGKTIFTNLSPVGSGGSGGVQTINGKSGSSVTLTASDVAAATPAQVNAKVSTTAIASHNGVAS